MLAAVVVGHARGRIARGAAVAAALGLVAAGSSAWPGIRLGTLADWSIAQCDVVVVAHHGSADELPALYRRIDAAVGLVGVGENDYGHPTDASLRYVREAGGQPLRTDELGTIALALDDDGVRVWSEHVGGPP